jgi:hypothetical protein
MLLINSQVNPQRTYPQIRHRSTHSLEILGRLAARNLLPQLHHSQIRFGLLVFEYTPAPFHEHSASSQQTSSPTSRSAADKRHCRTTCSPVTAE